MVMHSKSERANDEETEQKRLQQLKTGFVKVLSERIHYIIPRSLWNVC